MFKAHRDDLGRLAADRELTKGNLASLVGAISNLSGAVNDLREEVKHLRGRIGVTDDWIRQLADEVGAVTPGTAGPNATAFREEVKGELMGLWDEFDDLRRLSMSLDHRLAELEAQRAN